MGQIRLNNMKFFACHGCYPDEQRTGNHFLVDVVMDVDMGKASQTDNLNDALNYAEVYELVKQEMSDRSNLLEHVSARILNKFFVRFPYLERAEVIVSKLNPPVDGHIESVSVSQQFSRK